MGELHAMDPVGGANATSLTLKVKVAEDLALKGGGTLEMSGNYSPYYALRGCSKAQEKYAGKVISGLEEASALPQVMVFHAGTALDGESVVTSGGRVLSVTAIGETIDEAAERAYEAAAKIQLEGKQLRQDIGWRARTR